MTKLRMKDRLRAVFSVLATFGGSLTAARKLGTFPRKAANNDYSNCVSLSEKKISGSLTMPQTQSERKRKHHLGRKSANNPTLLTANLSDIASLLKADIAWMSFQDQDYVQDFNFLNVNAQNYNLQSLSNSNTASISVKESTGLFVPPCTDRNFWENYTIPTSFVQAAQYFVENEIPPWSDEDYLSDIKSGTRGVGQDMMISRNIRISSLLLAECKYNNGTFLPTIESDLVSVATQRSWVYPSSDPNLKYFNGKQYFMDLQSSYMTRQFGMILYMLGDILSSTTTTTVTNALYSRVFNPIKRSYDGTGPWQLWISSDSNINTVIWAGVMVAVFCVCGPDDRSYFASKSIVSSKLYLNTFMDDGFAVEGIGYFNYGFSHYSLLRQTLYEGTAGSYDAFAIPKAAQAALFAKEFGMNNGDGMNFADCHFGLYFDPELLKTIDKSFLDALSLEAATLPSRLGSINLASYISSTFSLDIPVVSGVKTYGMNALRHYYNVSGVLVTRPTRIRNGIGLAATIKLGGNLGGHSHDDLGSYVISLNGVKLTGDVGGPLYYDVNTFNSKRYSSPLMNSFGHPVPVVGGLLQTRATQVLSSLKNTVKVLSKNFTDEQDTITYDLMAAYNYSSLQSLSRKFMYNRLSSTITITDTVKFGKSSKFQDALITNKALTFSAGNSGYFYDDGNTLYFTVYSDAPFLMNATTLSSYNVTFTRVGIYLLSSVTSAKVTMVFKTTAMTKPSPVHPTLSPTTARPALASVHPTPSPTTARPTLAPVHPTPSPTTARPTLAPVHPTPSPTTARPTLAPVHLKPSPNTARPTLAPGNPKPSLTTPRPTLAPGHPKPSPTTARPTLAPGHPKPSLTTARPTLAPGHPKPSLTTARPTLAPGHLTPSPTTARPTLAPVHLTLSPTTTEPTLVPVHLTPSPTTAKATLDPVHLTPSPTTAKATLDPVHLTPSPTTPRPTLSPVAPMLSPTTSRPTLSPVATMPSPTTPRPALASVHPTPFPTTARSALAPVDPTPSPTITKPVATAKPSRPPLQNPRQQPNDSLLHSKSQRIRSRYRRRRPVTH